MVPLSPWQLLSLKLEVQKIPVFFNHSNYVVKTEVFKKE